MPACENKLCLEAANGQDCIHWVGPGLAAVCQAYIVGDCGFECWTGL